MEQLGRLSLRRYAAAVVVAIAVAALLAPSAIAAPSEDERAQQLLETLARAGDDAADIWEGWSAGDRQLATDAVTPASITAVTPASLGPEEKVCALISDVLHQGERRETECEIREDEVATADATANGGVAGATQRSGPLQPGCYNLQPKLVAKNRLGRTLWAYGASVDWCQDGVQITFASGTPWVSISSPFWFFRNHIADEDTAGAGHGAYSHFAQGNLEVCLVKGIGCLSNKTPFVKTEVTGTGGWNYKGGA